MDLFVRLRLRPVHLSPVTWSRLCFVSTPHPASVLGQPASTGTSKPTPRALGLWSLYHQDRLLSPLLPFKQPALLEKSRHREDEYFHKSRTRVSPAPLNSLITCRSWLSCSFSVRPASNTLLINSPPQPSHSPLLGFVFLHSTDHITAHTYFTYCFCLLTVAFVYFTYSFIY